MSFHLSKSPDRTQNTIVIHPHLHSHYVKNRKQANPEYRLEEACGLARAIGLNIVDQRIIPLRLLKPSTFIGEGSVDLIKPFIEELNVQLVVMDTALSAIQQRNLERKWKCKVIDRTGLILEIFGARARTAEGRLQVELASLTYQQSRLVRSWTHLERQRGGLGFIGGPGETQLEMDRRMIRERMGKLHKDLEKVRRTRELHRHARRRVPYPIVALVGYTNAGKSTLFNTLTQGDVFAADLLFATLDPSMGLVKLPSGQEVILSDTVGFISDLPTSLVAAFRATLEEVLEADLIIHVRDISHPHHDQQKSDVIKILKELKVYDHESVTIIDAYNKVDLLEDPSHVPTGKGIPLSALTGQGIDHFLSMIDDELRSRDRIYECHVPFEDGQGLSWLYNNGQVIHRDDSQDHIQLMVRMTSVAYGKLLKNHSHIRVT